MEQYCEWCGQNVPFGMDRRCFLGHTGSTRDGLGSFAVATVGAVGRADGAPEAYLPDAPASGPAPVTPVPAPAPMAVPQAPAPAPWLPEGEQWASPPQGPGAPAPWVMQAPEAPNGKRRKDKAPKMSRAERKRAKKGAEQEFAGMPLDEGWWIPEGADQPFPGQPFPTPAAGAPAWQPPAPPPGVPAPMVPAASAPSPFVLPPIMGPAPAAPEVPAASAPPAPEGAPAPSILTAFAGNEPSATTPGFAAPGRPRPSFSTFGDAPPPPVADPPRDDAQPVDGPSVFAGSPSGPAPASPANAGDPGAPASVFAVPGTPKEYSPLKARPSATYVALEQQTGNQDS